jgi:voltage-gated potassium channel
MARLSEDSSPAETGGDHTHAQEEDCTVTYRRLKQRTWALLCVATPGDKASRLVDLGLMTLIVLNVMEVVLSSVESINDRFAATLFGFEVFSVGVFTIEYLGRMWSCTASPAFSQRIGGRVRFFFRPMTLIDLVAIVPFYLPYLGVDLRVMRVFRMFRMFRVLKLGRYSRAFTLIRDAILGKREELVLTAMVLAVLLVVAASLMYYAERSSQPETFSSIPATLWWSVVTLTTVGYGDVYPVTTIGKIIAGIVSIVGIGMVALPAGIISASFVDEIAKRKTSASDEVCPQCGRRYEDV